ncbi:phosphotransferase [Exiguobacterium undae]|nr:phosphotransferase [Exiguobacterium undae]
MAIETSRINNESIKINLLEHYNIDVHSISKVNNGSANIYEIVSKNDKTYILKEFQSFIDKNKLKLEPTINQLLLNSKFPTSKILKTLKNEYLWSFNERIFHLQEKAEGIIFSQNNAPDWLLRDSAMYLAKLHEILKYLPNFPIGMPKSGWDNESKIRKIEKMIHIKKEFISLESSNFMILEAINCLDFKIKYLKESKLSEKNNFDNLTIKNTHGDFNLNQILIKNNSVESVIDFSSASALPASWEIIRSFTYSHKSSHSGEINILDLKKYIEEYLKYSLLTRDDINEMPAFYLNQLAFSLYGFEQYLKFQQDESLLIFAIWRTKLQKYLFENLQTINNDFRNWSIL